jgi:ABC-type nitrate/sulfonate/bicarbonate transport system substrate-binding protein
MRNSRLQFISAAGSAVAAATCYPAYARAQTKTLAVTVLTPSVLDAVMVVGIAKGIFQTRGVDVRPVPVPTGFAALKNITEGTAQVGGAGGTAVMQTVGKGANLTGILVTNGDATGKVPTDSYVTIVARGESQIRKDHIEDLRGKRVAVRRASDFHQYLTAALAANHIDVAEVTIVDTAELLPSLQGGSADAAVATATVAGRILAKLPGSSIVQQGGNYMQFLEMQVVSPQFLAAEPATLRQYVAAYAESAQYVRTHLDETADILLQQQLKDFGRNEVRSALGLLNPDMRISKATLDAMRAGGDFAVNAGILTKAPKPGDVVDTTFIRKVRRERPELFRDLASIPAPLEI